MSKIEKPQKVFKTDWNSYTTLSIQKLVNIDKHLEEPVGREGARRA
jgi:hypothetical protein